MAVTRLVSKPIRVQGRKTTIKLEPEFWALLLEICTVERKKIGVIVHKIQTAAGGEGMLASAIRVYILMYYRRLCDAPVLEHPFSNIAELAVTTHSSADYGNGRLR